MVFETLRALSARTSYPLLSAFRMLSFMALPLLGHCGWEGSQIAWKQISDQTTILAGGR